MTFLFSLLLCFCCLNSFSQDQASERARLDKLIANLHQLTELSLACHASKDCRLLPVGDRACGGPSSYAATSKNNPELSKIESLNRDIKQDEKEFNRRYRVISICEVEPTPEVVCVQLRCSLKTF
jgi:hypothetical protein